MKKILSLFLALTLVFALVACSNEKDTTSEPDTSTTQAETESTDTNDTQTSETDTDESSSDTETPSNSTPTTSTETSKPTTSNKDNTTSSKPTNTTSTPTTSSKDTESVKDINSAIEISYIELTLQNEFLAYGKTTTINAEIYPTNATNQNLQWKTSDPSIATVDNGEVKATGSGEVTITAIAPNGIKTSKKIKCLKHTIILPATPITVTEGKFASSWQKAEITSITTSYEFDYYPVLKISVKGQKTIGSDSLKQEIGYEIYDGNGSLLYRGYQNSLYEIKRGENFIVDIRYALPHDSYAETYQIKIIDTDM